MDKLNLHFQNLSEQKDIRFLTHYFTGTYWDFAIVTHKKWGKNSKVRRKKSGKPYYQLMPVGDLNKGDLAEEFFNWYCWVREYYQFFNTPEMCLIQFLYYWRIWEDQGMPYYRSVNQFE